MRLTAQQQIDARRAPTPTAFCMRPATATLGIRVTASVTLRELYGAHGAGIRDTPSQKKWASNRVLALGWGPKFLFFFVFF